MDSTERENAKFVASQLGMSEESAAQDAESDPRKLKSDGNITRQILAMIGHDTLESVYGVYHEGGDISGNVRGDAEACHRTGGKQSGKKKSCCCAGESGEGQAQGADYQADSLSYSDGENDGE